MGFELRVKSFEFGTLKPASELGTGNPEPERRNPSLIP